MPEVADVIRLGGCEPKLDDDVESGLGFRFICKLDREFGGLAVEVARGLLEGDLPHSAGKEKVGWIFLASNVKAVRLTSDSARIFTACASAT